MEQVTKEFGNLRFDTNRADLEYLHASLIRRWWKNCSSDRLILETRHKEKKEIDSQRSEIRSVIEYVRTTLPPAELESLVARFQTISEFLKNTDGGGLSGSWLADIVMCELFRLRLPEYEAYKCGECDMKICGVELSIKTIKNGKSQIALNWSKNKTASDTSHMFACHIAIVHTKTKQWWTSANQTRTNVVQSGIYIVDRDYCKRHVLLTSNNKTNTLIKAPIVYDMIQHSIRQKQYLLFPTTAAKYNFDILSAFVDGTNKN